MSKSNLFQPAEADASRETTAAKGSPAMRLLVALSVVAIFFLCFYQLFRGFSLFNAGYSWLDYIFAILLLVAEIFAGIHALGYLSSLFRANREANTARTAIFTSYAAPPVAIYLATYNEPREIIEDTLIALSGLEYPNLQIYLNCDSPKQPQAEMAQALAEKYGVNFYHRVPNTGYKAGGINLFIERLGNDLPYAKYMVVLDADQRPVRTFVAELVSIAESNPRIAFVQTPQYYANENESAVALGAASQQAVFYEYICEAKQVSDAMFCCGTNVLFRVEALREIGGFDETSVTEDFATSILLHQKGWTSHYHNNVYVYGVGPETLGAFFVQQSRWALGTVGVLLKRVLPAVFSPKLKLGQKWEYFMSGSYYINGPLQLILLTSPIAFLLFGIRPFIADPLIYVCAFLPNFLFSNMLFYTSVKLRKHRLKQVLAGQALSFISFWVFTVAVINAMMGKRKAFGVTPKGNGDRLPWSVLWPQLLFLVLSLVAVCVGVGRAIIDQNAALLVNVFWVLYHSVLLGTIFIFNRKVNIVRPEQFFNRYEAEQIG